MQKRLGDPEAAHGNRDMCFDESRVARRPRGVCPQQGQQRRKQQGARGRDFVAGNSLDRL